MAADHGVVSAVDVSAVIPCLNEERTVGEVVHELQAALSTTSYTFEIVIADNGSTDRSRDVARRAGARVCDAAGRRGVGAATAAGVVASRGRVVVLLDADGEHDPSDAPRLLEMLAETPSAVVLGSRYLGRFMPGASAWLNRALGTPVLTALLNRYFDIDITDCNTGFRAMSRQTFMQLGLTAPGFEFCSEMIAKAALHSVPLKEVPITQRAGPRGRTPHLRRFRDGWRHLKYILLHAPDRVLLRPGLVVTAIGAMLFLPQIGGRFELGPIAIDIHLMILGALLLFIGTEMVAAAAVCAGLSESPGPAARASRRYAEYFTLDRILPWGAAVFAMGFFADVAVVVTSGLQGWQGITVPRLALVGTTGMGLAVQLVVLSFVHSVVRQRRADRVAAHSMGSGAAASESPVPVALAPDDAA